MAIVVGDDNESNGFREAWAADEFTFGQAYQEEVPFEFSPTLGLLIVGVFWASNKIRKKLIRKSIYNIDTKNNQKTCKPTLFELHT